METRIELLKNITDTDPNRDMGSLERLKASIEKIGLINPLTIDTKGRLLAGRRRFAALTELGRKKCLVRVLSPKNRVDVLMISFHENLMRKPLANAENRRMMVEIDMAMREEFGSRKAGGDRPTKAEKEKEGFDMSQFDESKWSNQKTAESLGIGRTSVTIAKHAEAHIEKFPELKNEKTPVVIAHRQKEQLLDSLPKNDSTYLRVEEKDLGPYELKIKIEQGKEIQQTIESLPNSDFKRRMKKTYRNPYAKYVETPASVKEAIRRERGLTAGEKWDKLDKLDRGLSNWQDSNPELDKLLNTQEWRDQINKVRGSIKPLKRVDLPIGRFGSQEIAEAFANSHGGYSSGRGTVAGKEVWTIYVEE